MSYRILCACSIQITLDGIRARGIWICSLSIPGFNFGQHKVAFVWVFVSIFDLVRFEFFSLFQSSCLKLKKKNCLTRNEISLDLVMEDIFIYSIPCLPFLFYSNSTFAFLLIPNQYIFIWHIIYNWAPSLTFWNHTK